jgi:hypothetical protein
MNSGVSVISVPGESEPARHHGDGTVGINPDHSGYVVARRRSGGKMGLAVLLVRIAVSAVLSFVAVPGYAQRAPAAVEWTLPALMNTMRQVRESSGRFVETKYLRLLNQAQRSSGRLIYVAPDRLQKETLEPTTARLTIIGDRLTIERQGEKPKEISLRDYSEIGALVESVRATLAGDLPALTRHFNATLEGDPNSWALNLVPKEAKLRELVTAIRIRGERTAVRDVETTEADGDRTDMAVIPNPK